MTIPPVRPLYRRLPKVRLPHSDWLRRTLYFWASGVSEAPALPEQATAELLALRKQLEAMEIETRNRAREHLRRLDLNLAATGEISVRGALHGDREASYRVSVSLLPFQEQLTPHKPALISKVAFFFRRARSHLYGSLLNKSPRKQGPPMCKGRPAP